jgi:hypothetical protein
MRRFRDTVTITVPLAADEAMPLFTARGERRWVDGWEPKFPAGEPAEEDEGTVWITTAGDRFTFWVVAAKDADCVRYGRTTPGYTAGTVEVRVRSSDARETQLDVTYDLTAVTEEGSAELDDFASGFHEEIGSWEGLIRRLVSS